ncbi:MAG: RdgB/HAM1 family non-canonical purine NTP pyrophosphatase [Actinomycetes bacterium]
MTLRLVVATANPDKAREIVDVLTASGLDVELVERPADVPDVVEDGETLLDNARLKARALRDATGCASIADDTGLEVDALDGAPGVFSARYAGPDATYADNCAHLLAELARVGATDRSARFATSIVLALPDGSELDARGEVEGTIVEEPRGTGGFGYDPVFAPVGGDGATFAEMTPAAKHAISHRGRALRAMARRVCESLPSARAQE